ISCHALLIALNLAAMPASATVFNTDMLDTRDKTNVDLSAFSRNGYVMPGDYLLDIYLNETLVRSQYMVRFVSDEDQRTHACITPEIIALLGLKDEVARKMGKINGGSCLNLTTAHS